MTIDLDSTTCEVHGEHKHGAAYGYTKVLGYHPLLATRADTGEVLHARLRKGSSQRGAKRFAEELIARVRRAGATGALTVRGDAGFWSYALIDSLHRLGVHWSITVNINAPMQARINEIAETAWQPISYPDGGQAEVAETTITTRRSSRIHRPRTDPLPTPPHLNPRQRTARRRASPSADKPNSQAPPRLNTPQQRSTPRRRRRTNNIDADPRSPSYRSVDRG